MVDNDAGMLASVPLTLGVLLAAYRRDAESLRRGPRTLFALGMTALAEEHDPDRRPPVTSVDQRIAIASRIATHLQLCGRHTLWTGHTASVRPDDVIDWMLSGGPVLFNRRSARMDRHCATRRLWALAAVSVVRLPRMHPHMLRHTYVTTTLDAGVDLRDVQIAARHADPRTTVRYDRARTNLDRQPDYILTAYMASGT